MMNIAKVQYGSTTTTTRMSSSYNNDYDPTLTYFLNQLDTMMESALPVPTIIPGTPTRNNSYNRNKISSPNKNNIQQLSQSPPTYNYTYSLSPTTPPSPLRGCSNYAPMLPTQTQQQQRYNFNPTQMSAAVSAATLASEPVLLKRCSTNFTAVDKTTQCYSEQLTLATLYKNKIFVGSLARGISPGELAAFFRKFGMVTEAKVVLDDKGNSRGYGFVTFSNVESVNAVLTAGSIFLRNRRIAVATAIRKRHPDEE